MTKEEEDVKQKQARLDPEFFSLVSMIPLGGDKFWVRNDLFEDTIAFRTWLTEMQKFKDYELLLEMAYLGIKTGNVIIRGVR